MVRAEPSSPECRTYFPILWASRLCLQQLYKSSRCIYIATIACTCMPTMQQCILHGIDHACCAIHICFNLKGGRCSACLHTAAPPLRRRAVGERTSTIRSIYIYIYMCMHAYLYIYIHICIRMPTNYFKLCCVDSLHIHVSPMACSPMLAETCRTPDTWPRHPHATLGPLQDPSPKHRCRA